MDTFRGNAVVAQSGGPTAVVNASACGVIQEAMRYPQAIAAIYGANNGILGIVEEDLFDLRAESADIIEQLRCTPSSAIGSCRYNLGDLAEDRHKYDRLLEVFQAHEIRYFFYIGGNDSMATADKVNHLAADLGYGLRVIGVPKAVDNDLVGTDHCPGYGSTAKYLAVSAMEAGRDTEAMYTFDPVTIMETMGRNTGWLAASTGLAKRRPDEAPHLIYVPEIPFSPAKFIADVREVHKHLGRCFAVVSEGVQDEKGNYIAAETTVDAFGRRQLGGVASSLHLLVMQETGLKCRYNKLDTCQRNAVHFASRTDSDEAYLCGQEAVRLAVAGTTGVMVALERQSDRPYRCTTVTVPLAEVAGGVKRLPREYMDAAGTGISEAMERYARPLILGEVPLRLGLDGLPEFGRFQRRPVSRRLPAYAAH
jgi:ATP-dependent phosphofructokinase / diphosphate-dependent phosphofructokinase